MTPARPFRILLTTWHRKGAGAVQSIQYLAAGLVARGHEVRVACPPDGVLGRRLQEIGVPLVPFEFHKGWSLRSARALLDVVREYGIELVDAQESRDRKAAVVARGLLRMPARLVITRRAQSGSFPPANALYASVADRVIAISHGVARTLIRGGTPASKISVVHTGLDPRRVEGDVTAAEVEALRTELGLDPALPTFAVVARRKDQETLLRALARLGRPANALFVGIERDRRLADLEPALPAGSRVAYAGFRERILPFYRLMDVMVLTTRAEGLSQAILESMAVGVPVVSAAVGGTPEVVDDGRNGLLFPRGDAAALAERLERLLADAALGERLVRAARATVRERFHADALAAGTEAVYRQLLEPERPARRAAPEPRGER